MKKEIVLLGKEISLKILTNENSSKEYINWLGDKDINEFLEIRHSLPSENDLAKYVDDMLASDINYLFGIFTQDSNERHIGNIKLGMIDHKYSRGEIGLFLGDRNYWGKGFASEAINLISDFGFKKLALNKISAGADTSNIGSIKAFKENGFEQEALFKKHFKLNSGKWEDGVVLAKLSEHSHV